MKKIYFILILLILVPKLYSDKISLLTGIKFKTPVIIIREKDIIHKRSIEKSCIIKCPICFISSKLEKDFKEGSYVCPYCHNQFLIKYKSKCYMNTVKSGEYIYHNKKYLDNKPNKIQIKKQEKGYKLVYCKFCRKFHFDYHWCQPKINYEFGFIFCDVCSKYHYILHDCSNSQYYVTKCQYCGKYHHKDLWCQNKINYYFGLEYCPLCNKYHKKSFICNESKILGIHKISSSNKNIRINISLSK